MDLQIFRNSRLRSIPRTRTEMCLWYKYLCRCTRWRTWGLVRDIYSEYSYQTGCLIQTRTSRNTEVLQMYEKHFKNRFATLPRHLAKPTPSCIFLTKHRRRLVRLKNVGRVSVDSGKLRQLSAAGAGIRLSYVSTLTINTPTPPAS